MHHTANADQVEHLNECRLLRKIELITFRHSDIVEPVFSKSQQQQVVCIDRPSENYVSYLDGRVTVKTQTAVSSGIP